MTMKFFSRFKSGSKKALGKKYGNRVKRKLSKLSPPERKEARRMLLKPGKNVGGKNGKIMRLKLDQNRVKVGLKPTHSIGFAPNVAKGDISRFKRLKRFAGRNMEKYGRSVLIGAGSIVTTMLVFGRGNMTDGANKMGDIAESAWDLAENVGGAVEPILKGASGVIGGTSTALNFIADNFVLVCTGVVCLMSYRTLTKKSND